MFFGQFKNWYRQIGVQLVVGYCLLFFISSAGIFLTVYSLFSSSLARKDHEFISAKGKEYAAIYQKDGKEGLQRLVTDDHLQDVLVRLEGRSRETIFFHTLLNPEHFDVVDVAHHLASEKSADWVKLKGKEDGVELEILSIPEQDGSFLQVAMSTDSREDLLERLQSIFISALLLTGGVGIAGGVLFSKRVLRPVRKLIDTIKSLQSGDFKIRVPEMNTGDEMDTLISLFNDMLNRIQLLIRGMHETLDNVSHDLKTPLTRFRSSAETALREGASQQDQREALSHCLEQSDEIIAMMNSLMDISEAQAGTLKLNRERIDAGAIAIEVRDLYEMVAEEKKIRLNTDCSQLTPIIADRLRLKQVVANLVDNALKYSAEKTNVTLSTSATEFGICISVKDSGQGMAASELPRIWERLYRGDQSRSTPGRGLGLSLVQSIVRAHGGRVEVESEVGVGSRFSVHLPHSQNPEAIAAFLPQPNH